MWPQSLNYNRNFFILLEKKKNSIPGYWNRYFSKEIHPELFQPCSKRTTQAGAKLFLTWNASPSMHAKQVHPLGSALWWTCVCVFKTETLCTITSGRSSTEQTNRERCATSSRNGGRCMVAQQFQLYFPREIYLSITFMAFWQFWNHFWNSFMNFVFQN